MEKKGGMEEENTAADVPTRQGNGTGTRQRNKEALQRLNLENVTRNLILRQIREYTVDIGVPLMTLLQGCLETEHGRSSIVALSGYVEHFESRLEEDLGWGCGWRNIQMLSSYMLAQDSESKDVLFGGAGFIPDIPAIQQWLEIAWLKGFDVLGADYFDWKISGTQKWIGTTECATVLRSFGMRARIMDFRIASSKRAAGGMRGKGGSHLDQPGELDEADDVSGNFSLLKISSSHPEECSDDINNESDDQSPPTSGEDVSAEERRLIVLPDQKEELHFLRQSPDDPNICLTCVEERKNSTFANHLHREDDADSTASNKEMTEQNTSGDSIAGGGCGTYLPDTDSNHKYMTDWIWNYFRAEGGSFCKSIYLSNRSPLYFQHRGHSRTIVGIERSKREGSSKEEDYLLVLDPSQRTRDIVRSLERKQGWEELVKRGMHSLNQSEYQLCYVDPGIAKEEEYESLKTLSSVRYLY